ncbi:MAG: phosphotransferase [Phycisphaerales bacterium]|nr:MAG: phosphotransferase [Phycisphaerales bacterium]
MHESTAIPASPVTVQLNDLTVAAEHEGLLRANDVDSLDALFAVSDGESLTKPGLGSWRERIRLVLSDGEASRTFYLKRFTEPPTAVRRAVRRSGSGASSVAGAERAWMNRLTRDGIACPTPVAFGEDLIGSRERRSALLMEEVPGQSLESWATRWRAEKQPVVRELIEPTASLIARLHECGYIHRDLYLSHLFFDADAPADRALHLIDLQRVIRPAGRQGRWIVKDLASLNFSTPFVLFSNIDRLRWLKHYLGMSKLDASARRLVYRIVGKTRSIARHDSHRQARLQPRSDS